MRSCPYIFAIVFICGTTALAADAASGVPGTWQTSARWHRSFAKAVPGTLVLDAEGIEFRSARFTERWPYGEIHTFDLTAQELALWTYQRRPWHEPGERPFRFTLDQPLPADLAANLRERVERPVRDEVPPATAHAIAEIPAHHRTWAGGSNGMLRFKDDGIDYVSYTGQDSRSWRWADIETLANPDPFELRITGYREIVEFDLKQRLPRGVFESLWDKLYASGLNLETGEKGGLQ